MREFSEFPELGNVKRNFPELNETWGRGETRKFDNETCRDALRLPKELRQVSARDFHEHH